MWTPLVGVVVVLAALVPGSSARATATKAGARPFATLQFQPSQVALASAGGEVFVLGYKTCTINTCSGPELWAGTGSSFVQRTAPSGNEARLFEPTRICQRGSTATRSTRKWVQPPLTPTPLPTAASTGRISPSGET